MYSHTPLLRAPSHYNKWGGGKMVIQGKGKGREKKRLRKEEKKPLRLAATKVKVMIRKRMLIRNRHILREKSNSNPTWTN